MLVQHRLIKVCAAVMLSCFSCDANEKCHDHLKELVSRTKRLTPEHIKIFPRPGGNFCKIINDPWSDLDNFKLVTGGDFFEQTTALFEQIGRLKAYLDLSYEM